MFITFLVMSAQAQVPDSSAYETSSRGDQSLSDMIVDLVSQRILEARTPASPPACSQLPLGQSALMGWLVFQE